MVHLDVTDETVRLWLEKVMGAFAVVCVKPLIFIML
jgi:hypothetical protein